MVIATAALGLVIGLVIGGLGGGGGALTVPALSGATLTRIFALLLLLVGIFVGTESLLAG